MRLEIVQREDVDQIINSRLFEPIKELLQTFENGFEESCLPDLVGNQEDLVLAHYALECLKKRGAVAYVTDLIKLTPTAQEFRIADALPPTLALSRFMLCRPRDGIFIIETPLSAAAIEIKDFRLFEITDALQDPTSVEELYAAFSYLNHKELENILLLLFSAKIVSDQEESVSLRQWEYHDLYFHTRSRQGRHNNPIGGTYRFKGVIPPTPALKKCENKSELLLEKPVEKLVFPLGEALRSRKSVRSYGDQSLTAAQLGAFLFHAASISEFFKHEEGEFTRRSYPGAGACYELELYPVIASCEGIEAGVYHYHPDTHALCSMGSQPEPLLQQAQQVSYMEDVPPVLFVITARFQRIAWKYESIAYATTLKNAGTLIQTMYLVATAMGLAPCALGSGDSDLFSRLIGADYYTESSIGEFMLGTAPLD